EPAGAEVSSFVTRVILREVKAEVASTVLIVFGDVGPETFRVVEPAGTPAVVFLGKSPVLATFLDILHFIVVDTQANKTLDALGDFRAGVGLLDLGGTFPRDVDK